MNDLVVLKIMEVLYRDHRGRENAITREKLEEKLRPWIDIGDRKFRANYAHVPLCACEEGIFRPIRPEEVVEYRAWQFRQRNTAEALIEMKIRRLYATWPELIPVPVPVQRPLFGEEARP